MATNRAVTQTAVPQQSHQALSWGLGSNCAICPPTAELVGFRQWRLRAPVVVGVVAFSALALVGQPYLHLR